MKLRLLFTSALLLFVQIAAMHAQETVDVAKITCRQISLDQLATPRHDVLVWLGGYYNGQRNNTTIDLLKIKNDLERLSSYCDLNPKKTVLDALENVFGSDK